MCGFTSTDAAPNKPFKGQYRPRTRGFGVTFKSFDKKARKATGIFFCRCGGYLGLTDL